MYPPAVFEQFVERLEDGVEVKAGFFVALEVIVTVEMYIMRVVFWGAIV